MVVPARHRVPPRAAQDQGGQDRFHRARSRGCRAGAEDMTAISVRPAAFIWALFGIVSVEIVVTYARIPPHELYHVSGNSVADGFGRAVVFLNFPVALAAL